MKQHEREFFIYKVRSGKVFLDNDIEIRPPTVEQYFKSCVKHNESYEDSFNDEVMTEEEMLEWMTEHNMWSEDKEARIEGLKKDLERLKVEIFNARNNENLAKKIRLYIRAGEKQLAQELHIKNQYIQNTCEGIAQADKVSYLIEQTTYKDNKLYDFSDITIQEASNSWYQDMLPEKILRELARNDPWKTVWSIYGSGSDNLFLNSKNEELTYNKKSLVIWSKMYDNIHESMECPNQDVIDDDDMLDGWFIIQSKKRDKERSENEFETNTNEKIKNSSEIFVVTKTEKDRERIENMNDGHNKVIKRQRAGVMRKKGTAEQHHFPDEILRIKAQQTEAWKNRGGK